MATNKSSDVGDIGCLVFLILAFCAEPFIAVLGKLFNIALVGVFGYAIFQLVKYDRKTGKITLFFNQLLTKKEADIKLEQNQEGVYQLPEKTASNELVLKELDNLSNKVVLLQQGQEETRIENEKIVKNTIQEYSESIDRKNKKELLNNVFGNELKEYSESDVYEKRKGLTEQKEREENLSNREFQQSMKEQVYDFRMEAKEDRFALRTQMQDSFLYLEKQYASLREFTIEKTHFLNAKIDTQIADVKTLVGNLRVELKEDISGLRIEMNRELVRVDTAMLKIVGKLEEYNTRCEKYSYEVKKATVEAERNTVKSERMLNQASSLYAHHKADLRVLGKDIDVAVHKIALHNGDFANKVAGAKLMLDRSSMEQTNALKEISYEKMGATMLRDSYIQKTKLAETNMQKLISENRHIEEKMAINSNNQQRMSQLQHQLNMNRESLSHSRNQNSAIRQEFSLFKRLSK